MAIHIPAHDFREIHNNMDNIIAAIDLVIERTIYAEYTPLLRNIGELRTAVAHLAILVSSGQTMLNAVYPQYISLSALVARNLLACHIIPNNLKMICHSAMVRDERTYLDFMATVCFIHKRANPDFLVPTAIIHGFIDDTPPMQRSHGVNGGEEEDVQPLNLDIAGSADQLGLEMQMAGMSLSGTASPIHIERTYISDPVASLHELRDQFKRQH
jgi:hypothetical protein